MAVTIKEIAVLVGVSRGTVDRALNDRGGVKPEVEKRIKELAKKLDYKPNMMAKALANSRKKVTIGVLVNSGGNPFFDKVLSGIKRAKSEIASFYVNVAVRTLTGYDVNEQIEAIELMVDEGVSALVITAINDSLIAEKLNEVSDIGIIVITLNSDISGVRKLCFVGCDYLKSGQTAGELMGLIVQHGVSVGIITGSNKMLGHVQRIEGFKRVLLKRYADKCISIVDVVECFDDDIKAYAVTKKLLEDHPNITALYFCAAGINGGVKAVCELPPDRKISVITVDDTDNVAEYLKQDKIAMTVCQQPFKQGYDSVKFAFDKLIEGKVPQRKHMYTHNEVKTRYNI